MTGPATAQFVVTAMGQQVRRGENHAAGCRTCFCGANKHSNQVKRKVHRKTESTSVRLAQRSCAAVDFSVGAHGLAACWLDDIQKSSVVSLQRVRYQRLRSSS